MMRRIALLVLALSLSGCSIWDNLFSSNEKTDPAKLLPIETTLTVRSMWHVSVGDAGRYYFSPAVVGGAVFAAGTDGNIVRINGTTGAVVWQIKVDDRLSAGVGASETALAVATVKGDVITFNAEGKQLWRAATGGEVLSPPAIGGGLVVARTTDGRFVAFDQTTGEKRWNYVRQPQALVLRGAPGMLITQGTLIAGLPGGRMVSLTLANGGLRWEVPVATPKGATELERVADVTGTPVLSGGEVCVATFQGRAGCFDAATGNALWARDVSTPTGLGVATKVVFVTDEKSVVQSFSRSGGASVWKNDKLQYRSLSTPVPVGNAVAAGDYQGIVHWFGFDDGKIIARTSTDDSAITATPVGTTIGGAPGVIFQTRKGGLFAFATS